MATEKRLIDADDAEQFARNHILDAMERYLILGFLRDCATVDAVEVVHGHWAPVKYNAHCSCGKSYETYHYLCSACNRIAYAQPYVLTYCPNCGAKMDGEPQLPSRYSNGRSSGE